MTASGGGQPSAADPPRRGIVRLPLPALLAPRRLVGLPAEALRHLAATADRTSPRRPARRRVVESRPGRVYLPVRAVHRPDGGPVADALERALSAIEGVHWASVNPVLAEVAIAFEDGSVGTDDLVDVVEAVEREHGVHDEALPQDLPAHPADEVPLQRTLVELAADGIGVGVGMMGRVLRLPGVPVQVANALPALVSTGPLRSVVEARPGFEMATVAASSVLQGFGHQPLGLLVDAAHRGAVLAELASRRRAWLALEHRLHPGPPPHRPPAVELDARPQPLPPGLAERTARRRRWSRWAARGSVSPPAATPAAPPTSCWRACHGRSAWAPRDSRRSSGGACRAGRWCPWSRGCCAASTVSTPWSSTPSSR